MTDISTKKNLPLTSTPIKPKLSSNRAAAVQERVKDEEKRKLPVEISAVTASSGMCS